MHYIGNLKLMNSNSCYEMCTWSNKIYSGILNIENYSNGNSKYLYLGNMLA